MNGQYGAKLDEKNRLFVPSKLRDDLGERFIVTVGMNCGHHCLTAYTESEWQRISDNYNALSISKRSGATSLLFMKAVECIPDKQNRFALTPSLLKYAGITRDVVIAGRAGQAEIWDAEEFERFEEEYLVPEKLQESLEAIGL